MNYKNRKPKAHKAHCGMCCLRTTDGRRNGRRPTLQERRMVGRERDLMECAESFDTCGGEFICDWCLRIGEWADPNESHIPWGADYEVYDRLLALSRPLRVSLAEVAA